MTGRFIDIIDDYVKVFFIENGDTSLGAIRVNKNFIISTGRTPYIIYM